MNDIYIHAQVEALQKEYGPTVNSKDAAKIIGSTPSTLGFWRHKGRGPSYIKSGKSCRYSIASLVEYLQENTVRCT